MAKKQLLRIEHARAMEWAGLGGKSESLSEVERQMAVEGASATE